MNSKINKKLQKENSSHLTILLMLFIVAGVALCIALLFNFGSKTKSDSSVQKNTDLNPTINNNPKIENNKETSNRQFSGAVPNATIVLEDAKTKDNNSGESKMTETTYSQEKAAILCTEETSVFCIVNKTNPLNDVFDKNPFVMGAVVDWKNVNVEKISHQLVYRSLAENNVTDSAGKILASSHVSYKEQTKELVVLIGVDKKYYLSLSVSEQKTLYTSQFVRAIFLVTGEIPSNYPKVSKTVGKLSYWDPNVE